MPRTALRRFPMAIALALVAPLALSGCAGVSADWVKTGASEAQVKADNAACRAEAEDVYGQSANITHDIQVSRPRAATDVDARSKQIRSYDVERDYDKVFDACMAAHGYRKGGASR